MWTDRQRQTGSTGELVITYSTITMGLLDKALESAPARLVQGFKNSFKTDLQTRNWSVYGQWLGVACFILDIVLGVINLLHVSLIIIFSIICIVEGVCILFLEVPFLLRICPITDQFAGFIRVFHQNLPRAGFYLILAAIQYAGIAISTTSLIACAVLMTITSACYFLAHFTHQDFIESAALGGEGVAREVLP